MSSESPTHSVEEGEESGHRVSAFVDAGDEAQYLDVENQQESPVNESGDQDPVMRVVSVGGEEMRQPTPPSGDRTGSLQTRTVRFGQHPEEVETDAHHVDVYVDLEAGNSSAEDSGRAGRRHSRGGAESFDDGFVVETNPQYSWDEWERIRLNTIPAGEAGPTSMDVVPADEGMSSPRGLSRSNRQMSTSELLHRQAAQYRQTHGSGTMDRSITRPTQLDPSQLSLAVLNTLNMSPEELSSKLRENPIQCIEEIVARTQVQVDKESNALKPRDPFTARKYRHRAAMEYQDQVDEADDVKKVQTKQERKKKAYLKRFLRRFQASVIDRLNPFRSSMRRVEAHFGTGIASLFAFEQNIIWLNFWMALLWGAFVNIPWAVNRPQRFIDTDVKYKGIVGLDGMETSWLYYGGYDARQGNYNMALAYSCVLVITFAFAFVVILKKIGWYTRQKSAGLVSKDPLFPYSGVLFGSYDFNIRDPASRVTHLQTIASHFKEMLQSEQDQEKKESQGLCSLVFRRLLGFLLTGMVLVGSAISIWYLSLNEVSLNSSFPFTVSLIISVMNILLPQINDKVVEFEKYTTAVEIRNKIGRNYFLKMFNIIFLMFQVNKLTDSKGVISLTNCPEINAGELFQQLLIVDMGVALLSAFMAVWIKFIFNKKDQSGNRTRTEFKIPGAAISAMYRQCLIFMASSVAPMLAFIGTFSNLFVYLVQIGVLFRFCKYPERPWSSSLVGAQYYWLLLGAWVLALVPVAWFMQRTAECGPHAGSEPYQAFNSIVNSQDWLRDIFSWVVNPLVLMGVIVILGATIYLTQKRTQRYRARLTDTREALQEQLDEVRRSRRETEDM